MQENKHFSLDSSTALWMAMSAGWLVHYYWTVFSWHLSYILGLQRMNPPTFPVAPPAQQSFHFHSFCEIWGFLVKCLLRYWNVEHRNVVDLHGLQRINPNGFAILLAVSAVSPARQCFHFTSCEICHYLLNWFPPFCSAIVGQQIINPNYFGDHFSSCNTMRFTLVILSKVCQQLLDGLSCMLAWQHCKHIPYTCIGLACFPSGCFAFTNNGYAGKWRTLE